MIAAGEGATWFNSANTWDVADTPNAADVLTVTGYTTDDAGVLWYFGTDYRTKAEFYVIANQMTAVDEETARALMAQIDANQPTEPEQPEQP